MDFCTEFTFCVSILAPAWGHLRVVLPEPFLPKFQFSPPHGGILCVSTLPSHLGQVSILAPAWGHRNRGENPGAVQNVSILAPAWGHHVLGARSSYSLLFQFSPPHGGINTDSSVRHSQTGFNSRPRMGASPKIDKYLILIYAYLYIFSFIMSKLQKVQHYIYSGNLLYL